LAQGSVALQDQANHVVQVRAAHGRTCRWRERRQCLQLFVWRSLTQWTWPCPRVLAAIASHLCGQRPVHRDGLVQQPGGRHQASCSGARRMCECSARHCRMGGCPKTDRALLRRGAMRHGGATHACERSGGQHGLEGWWSRCTVDHADKRVSPPSVRATPSSSSRGPTIGG